MSFSVEMLYPRIEERLVIPAPDEERRAAYHVTFEVPQPSPTPEDLPTHQRTF